MSSHSEASSELEIPLNLPLQKGDLKSSPLGKGDGGGLTEVDVTLRPS
jgi:hypothetical protein